MRLKLLLLAGAVLAIVVPSTAVPSPSTHSTPAQGIVCTNGSLAGLTRTFDLETSTGYIYMPDGNTVFMWGYDETALGHDFQAPGPVLCANEGETVVVNLANDLGEPTSLVFPGQCGVTSPGGVAPGPDSIAIRDAANGGSVQYSFAASEPGTYLYESGTDPEKQVEMGLYGAIVVRPVLGDNYTYNASRTQFDPAREHVLLLSEIDSDHHAAVEAGASYDRTQLKSRYFLINGRAFPDTIADNLVPWLPNQPYGALVTVKPLDEAGFGAQPALLRYLNAGIANHPFHPHGNHLRVIARDGRLLEGPALEDTSFENFTRTVGSGQTYDLLFKWIFKDDPGAGLNGQGWSPTTTLTTRPIPAPLSSYRNLMHPDDVTLYSGNPYLGYKGTLPLVVTSFNQCGEYYFPWHSHALQEIVNFDEAFGGMMTMLRVDPAGGAQVNAPYTPCS